MKSSYLCEQPFYRFHNQKHGVCIKMWFQLQTMDVQRHFSKDTNVVHVKILGLSMEWEA